MKCINCAWQGPIESTDTVERKGWINVCPVCGNNTEQMALPPEVKEKVLDGPDLDVDGDFDTDDVSIAGRALAKGKKLNKKGK